MIGKIDSWLVDAYDELLAYPQKHWGWYLPEIRIVHIDLKVLSVVWVVVQAIRHEHIAVASACIFFALLAFWFWARYRRQLALSARLWDVPAVRQGYRVLAFLLRNTWTAFRMIDLWIVVLFAVLSIATSGGPMITALLIYAVFDAAEDYAKCALPRDPEEKARKFKEAYGGAL